MGLRCSLLGHDYGEPFVERGREERGNEVVVTERELQECSRCGAENVTTENTEVRSLQSTSTSADSASATSGPTASASNAGSSDGSAVASGSSAGESSAASAGSDDDASTASEGGAFTSASDAIERAEASMDAGSGDATASTDVGAGDATSSDEDDAVIIDSSADDAAGSEQWDEQEVDPDAEPEPTPDPDGEDVEFVDGSPTDDAGATAGEFERGSAATAGSESNGATAGSESGGAQAVGAQRSSDRPRGEWPEPEGEDVGVDATDDDVAFQFGDEDDAVVTADTGFTSAGPLEQTGDDDLDFALYCPECGFERQAAGSSLRAGDICPDCRKGYLAEDR